MSKSLIDYVKESSSQILYSFIMVLLLYAQLFTVNAVITKLIQVIVNVILRHKKQFITIKNMRIGLFSLTIHISQFMYATETFSIEIADIFIKYHHIKHVQIFNSATFKQFVQSIPSDIEQFQISNTPLLVKIVGVQFHQYSRSPSDKSPQTEDEVKSEVKNILEKTPIPPFIFKFIPAFNLDIEGFRFIISNQYLRLSIVAQFKTLKSVIGISDTNHREDPFSYQSQSILTQFQLNFYENPKFGVSYNQKSFLYSQSEQLLKIPIIKTDQLKFHLNKEVGGLFTDDNIKNLYIDETSPNSQIIITMGQNTRLNIGPWYIQELLRFVDFLQPFNFNQKTKEVTIKTKRFITAFNIACIFQYDTPLAIPYFNGLYNYDCMRDDPLVSWKQYQSSYREVFKHIQEKKEIEKKKRKNKQKTSVDIDQLQEKEERATIDIFFEKFTPFIKKQLDDSRKSKYKEYELYTNNDILNQTDCQAPSPEDFLVSNHCLLVKISGQSQLMYRQQFKFKQSLKDPKSGIQITLKVPSIQIKTSFMKQVFLASDDLIFVLNNTTTYNNDVQSLFELGAYGRNLLFDLNRPSLDSIIHLADHFAQDDPIYLFYQQNNANLEKLNIKRHYFVKKTRRLVQCNFVNNQISINLANQNIVSNLQHVNTLVPSQQFTIGDQLFAQWVLQGDKSFRYLQLFSSSQLNFATNYFISKNKDLIFQSIDFQREQVPQLDIFSKQEFYDLAYFNTAYRYFQKSLQLLIDQIDYNHISHQQAALPMTEYALIKQLIFPEEQRFLAYSANLNINLDMKRYNFVDLDLDILDIFIDLLNVYNISKDQCKLHSPYQYVTEFQIQCASLQFFLQGAQDSHFAKIYITKHNDLKIGEISQFLMKINNQTSMIVSQPSLLEFLLDFEEVVLLVNLTVIIAIVRILFNIVLDSQYQINIQDQFRIDKENNLINHLQNLARKQKKNTEKDRNNSIGSIDQFAQSQQSMCDDEVVKKEKILLFKLSVKNIIGVIQTKSIQELPRRGPYSLFNPDYVLIAHCNKIRYFVSKINYETQQEAFVSPLKIYNSIQDCQDIQHFFIQKVIYKFNNAQIFDNENNQKSLYESYFTSKKENSTAHTQSKPIVEVPWTFLSINLNSLVYEEIPQSAVLQLRCIISQIIVNVQLDQLAKLQDGIFYSFINYNTSFEKECKDFDFKEIMVKIRQVFERSNMFDQLPTQQFSFRTGNQKQFLFDIGESILTIGNQRQTQQTNNVVILTLQTQEPLSAFIVTNFDKDVSIAIEATSGIVISLYNECNSQQKLLLQIKCKIFLSFQKIGSNNFVNFYKKLVDLNNPYFVQQIGEKIQLEQDLTYNDIIESNYKQFFTYYNPYNYKYSLTNADLQIQNPSNAIGKTHLQNIFKKYLNIIKTDCIYQQDILVEQKLIITLNIRDNVEILLKPESVQSLFILQQYQFYQTKDNLEDILEIYSKGYQIDFYNQFMLLEQDLRNILVLIQQESKSHKRKLSEMNFNENDLASLEIQDSQTIVSAEDLQQQLEQYEKFQCIKYPRIHYKNNYWKNLTLNVEEKQENSQLIFDFNIPFIKISMIGIGQNILFSSDKLIFSLQTNTVVTRPQFILLQGIAQLHYLCKYSLIKSQIKKQLKVLTCKLEQQNIKITFSNDIGFICTQNYSLSFIQTPQDDFTKEQIKLNLTVSQIQAQISQQTLLTVVQFGKAFQFQNKNGKTLEHTKLQQQQQEKVFQLYLLSYSFNEELLLSKNQILQLSQQQLQKLLTNLYHTELQQQIIQFCYKIQSKQSVQFIYNLLNNAADSFKMIPPKKLQQYLKMEFPSQDSLSILNTLAKNINFKKVQIKKQIKYLSIDLLSGSCQANINFNGFNCVFISKDNSDLEQLLQQSNYLNISQLQSKTNLYLTDDYIIESEALLLIKNPDLSLNNEIIQFIFQNFEINEVTDNLDLSNLSNSVDDQFLDIVEDQPKGIFQDNENFRSLIQNLVLQQQLSFGRKLMKFINGINIQLLMQILNTQLQFSMLQMNIRLSVPSSILSISTQQAEIYPTVLNQFQINNIQLLVQENNNIISQIEVYNFNIIQRSQLEQISIKNDIKEDLITMLQISLNKINITFTDQDVGFQKLLLSMSLVFKDVNQSIEKLYSIKQDPHQAQNKITKLQELPSVIIILNFKQIYIEAKLSNFIQVTYTAANIVTELHSLGAIDNNISSPVKGFTTIYEMILTINNQEPILLPKIILFYAFYQQLNHINCSTIISSKKININVETIALLTFVQQNLIKYKIYLEKLTKGSKRQQYQSIAKQQISTGKSFSYSFIIQSSPIILNVGIDEFVFNFITNEIQLKFTNASNIIGNAFGTNEEIKLVNNIFGPKYYLIVSQIYFIQSKHWINSYFGIKQVYNNILQNCLSIVLDNNNIKDEIYLLVSTGFICDGVLSKHHLQNTIDIQQISCHIHPNLIFAIKQVYTHFKFLLQTLVNNENQQQQMIKLRHIQKQFTQEEQFKQNSSFCIKLNVKNVMITLQTFRDVQLQLNVPTLFFEQLIKQQHSDLNQHMLTNNSVKLSIDQVVCNLVQQDISANKLIFKINYELKSNQNSPELCQNSYSLKVEDIVLYTVESFGFQVYSIFFSFQFVLSQQVQVKQELFIKYKEINIDQSIIDNLLDQQDVFVDFSEQLFIQNTINIQIFNPKIQLNVESNKDFQHINLVLPNIFIYVDQYTQPFGRLIDYQTENCYKIFKSIIEQFNIGCLTFNQPFQQENVIKVLIGKFDQQLPQEIFIYAQQLLKQIDFVQIYENKVELEMNSNKFIPKFNSDTFNQNIKLAQKEILLYFKNNIIMQIISQIEFFKLTIHSSSNKQNYDENYASLVIFLDKAQFILLKQNEDVQLFILLKQLVFYTIQNNMLLPIKLYQQYVGQLPLFSIPLALVLNNTTFSFSQQLQNEQTIISCLINLENIQLQSSPLSFQSMSIFYHIWSQNIAAMVGYIKQQLSSLETVKKNISSKLTTSNKFDRIFQFQFKIFKLKFLLQKSIFYNMKDITNQKLIEQEISEEQVKFLLASFIKIKDQQQKVDPILDFQSKQQSYCCVFEIIQQSSLTDSFSLSVPGFETKLTDDISFLQFNFNKTLIQMQNQILQTQLQVSFEKLQLIHTDNQKLIMNLNLDKSYLHFVIQQQQNNLIIYLGDFIGSFAVTTVQSISKILSTIIFESKSYWNLGAQTIQQSSLFLLPDYITSNQMISTIEDMTNLLQNNKPLKSPLKNQSRIFQIETTKAFILNSNFIKHFAVKNNLKLTLNLNKIIVRLSQYSLEDKLFIYLRFSETKVVITSTIYPQDSFDTDQINFQNQQLQRYNFINNRIDIQFTIKTKQIQLQLIDVYENIKSFDNLELLHQQKKLKISTVLQLNDSSWSIHSTNSLRLNFSSKTVFYSTFAQIFSNPGKFIIGDNIMRISEIINQMIKDVKCFILTIQKQVNEKIEISSKQPQFHDNLLILEENGTCFLLKEIKFKNIDSLFPTLDILGKCTGLLEILTKNISGVQKVIEQKVDSLNQFAVEICWKIDRFASQLLE